MLLQLVVLLQAGLEQLSSALLSARLAPKPDVLRADMAVSVPHSPCSRDSTGEEAPSVEVADPMRLSGTGEEDCSTPCCWVVRIVVRGDCTSSVLIDAHCCCCCCW
jgi:hypothetical protein